MPRCLGWRAGGPTGSGRLPRRRESPSCFLCRDSYRRLPASRSATPSSRSSDHMGMNSSSRTARITAIPAAIDQAVALAKYPNVSVKLSGAPGNSLEPYPFRDMTVHLQRLFEAYGPERCYWGTDITNSFAKASYRERVTHFTEELSFLSESDKEWGMARDMLARLKWAF